MFTKTHFRWLSLSAIAIASLAGCSGASDAEGPDAQGTVGDGLPVDGVDGSSPSGFGDPHDEGEEMPPAPTITPTGFLLLHEEALARAQALVESNDPRWLSFKAQTDKFLDRLDINMASPENGAMMYRLTGDPAYAQIAYDFAVVMQGENVRGGSYLEFGNLMRHSAVVLNLCGDALSAAQKNVLVSYLTRWTDELWFDNQGSGWGLEDSGNNYHMAFLQGTAYAGYALRQEGIEKGQEYIDLVYDKLQKEGGVFDYLAKDAAGGTWREGINYGERSNQRLSDALAAIASMDGVNFFYEHPFWRETIYFTAYALQNDNASMHPAGDLARDAAMLITPNVRDYLSTIATFLPDMKARRLATWIANEISPDYETPGYRIHAYRDLALGIDGEAISSDEAKLPLGYFATGSGWLNFRSGWGANDVSFTVAAPSVIDQSHQHVDAASFTLFKNGWQALDAGSMSGTGLNQLSASHNTLHVVGSEARPGEVGGVTSAIDTASYGYVGVDATRQYRYRPGSETPQEMLDEHTRELVYLRPGVVVVYDRVDAKPGHAYEWRLHTATAPSASGDRYEAISGGQRISVQKLAGGAQSTARDNDLPDFPSEAYRIVTAAEGELSRFLHVVTVDEASAPVATAQPIEGPGIAGAVVGEHAVVFSEAAFGTTPAEVSYSVPSQPGRNHLIANQNGPVNVSLSTSGQTTTVTVTPGGDVEPNDAGIVEIVE
jgi:hypothetical protein